jgi:transcriptional regulator with XRE-family HTH domain
MTQVAPEPEITATLPRRDGTMTADEFTAAIARLGISRRQLCERIGVARRSADAYALGRAPVPRTVELAIRAVEAGLDHDHRPPVSRARRADGQS